MKVKGKKGRRRMAMKRTERSLRGRRMMGIERTRAMKTTGMKRMMAMGKTGIMKKATVMRDTAMGRMGRETTETATKGMGKTVTKRKMMA